MNYTQSYPAKCIKCGRLIRPKQGTSYGNDWCKCNEPNYANCTSDEEKNPAHFCACGKFLGHRGFCSDKCHDEHYDANCVEGEK